MMSDVRGDVAGEEATNVTCHHCRRWLKSEELIAIQFWDVTADDVGEDPDAFGGRVIGIVGLVTIIVTAINIFITTT